MRNGRRHGVASVPRRRLRDVGLRRDPLAFDGAVHGGAIHADEFGRAPTAAGCCSPRRRRTSRVVYSPLCTSDHHEHVERQPTDGVGRIIDRAAEREADLPGG